MVSGKYQMISGRCQFSLVPVQFSSEAQVRLTYPLDLLGPRLGRELTALSFRKTKEFSEVTLVREDNPKQDAKQDQR